MATQAYAWKDIVTTFMNAAGTSATVAEIKTVPAPQFTAEDIDVTNQDSDGVKEFIAGMKEGNEIEFIGNDVPSDTGQGLLLAAADAGESGTFTLTFPSKRSITFTAAIKTFDIVEDNGAGAFSCKVKVSGKPTRGTSAIQLSGLTTTAGTIFPSPFAAGTYLYTVAATHPTDTCTVTPTSSGGGTIKVNGTTVVSGQASGNIALTDAATTEIGILVTKAGSTATMYKIIVSRAAS